MTARGATPLVEGASHPLEAQIEAKARRFDLPALLAALQRIGYGVEDLRFRGNPDPSPPRGIVDAVRFERSPRQAIITLNMGLNGHRGWLPAYFEQVAESLPEPERLHRFVEFFEDGLLRDYAQATTPELHPRYRPLIDARFAALGLGSPSTLTWLFELVFPELGVRCRRTGLDVRTDAHALVTGPHHRLDGSSVLGSSHDASQSGFRVDLFTTDEYAPTGRTWWSVATERLRETIQPLLAESAVLLEVVLIVADHASWARIRADGQLGYDRLAGDAGEHRVLIFRHGAFRAEDLIPGNDDRWAALSPWNAQIPLLA